MLLLSGDIVAGIVFAPFSAVRTLVDITLLSYGARQTYFVLLF